MVKYFEFFLMIYQYYIWPLQPKFLVLPMPTIMDFNFVKYY